MINNNYRFILLGNNEKRLNNHCFCPYEKKSEWFNITDKVLSNFISPYIDIKFDSRSTEEKIEYINDFYPDIKIVQNDLIFSEEFKHGDTAIFVSESNEFLGVFEFHTHRFLYSNYNISHDEDGFNLKTNPNIMKNGIKKSEIDFETMIKGSNQVMLHKYNLYHKLKNTTNLNKNKLRQYILDYEPNYFDINEDFSVFNLPFESYCVLSSVNSFVPDFYFNLSGDPVVIIHENINEYIKNVRDFIRIINKIPSETKITQYEYQD